MSVCNDLRKEQSRLEKTLADLLKKLAADTARHDSGQIADDEAGIAVAESELANLEEQLLENGCYLASDDLPQPPPTLDVRTVPGTFRPGDPFSARWRFGYSDTTSKFGIGDLVAVNLFLNQFGTRTHLWGRDKITFPADTTPPTNTITDEPPITPTLAQAAIIYKIGADAQIILHVDGNGPDGPFEASTDLFVKKWEIDPRWWSWDVPANQEKEWKEAYTLSGKLYNDTLAGMQGATITLMESEGGGTATPVSTLTVGKMKPSSDFSAAFPAISKDWEWISGAPFFTVHDTLLVKDFEYYVTFFFTEDEYGNLYGDMLQSSSVHVVVAVAKSKVAAGTLAMHMGLTAVALLAAAAIAAALPFVGAAVAKALFAAAIALLALAATARGAAMDPPVPDPDYRQPVGIPPPPGGGAAGALPKTLELITILRYLLDLENARLQIPGRVLAARYFRDAPFSAVHEQTYTAVVVQIRKSVARLKALSPAVQDELATRVPIAGNQFAEVAAKARTGSLTLPPDDVPQEQQQLFLTLLADGATMSRVSTLGLDGIIRTLVQAAVDLAVSLPSLSAAVGA